MSDETSLKTTEFGTGAVRSAELNGLDFTSLPLLAFFGLARTASEGAQKYGRYNYLQGMPEHDLHNHVVSHLLMDILGDRSEPNLEHAMWGIGVIIQQRLLNPELSAPHMLGPGVTLTDANKGHLAALAPILKAKREAGEFKDSGHWKMTDIPQVAKLLEQREHVQPTPDDVRHRERCRKFDDAVEAHAEQTRIDDHNATVTKEACTHNAYLAETRDSNREMNRLFSKDVIENSRNRLAEEIIASYGAKPQRLYAVTHDGVTRAVPGEIWLRDKLDQDQESPWEKVLIVGRAEDNYALMSAELNGVRTMVVTKAAWDKAPRSIILHPGFDVDARTINGVPVIGFNRATTMAAPSTSIELDRYNLIGGFAPVDF